MAENNYTVDDALKELRTMFPTGHIEIAYGENRKGDRYVAFEGSSKERWTPKKCGESLEDVMTQVRDWCKENQR